MSNLFSNLFNNKNLSEIKEKFSDELHIINSEDKNGDEELYAMMLNILRLRKVEAKEIMIRTLFCYPKYNNYICRRFNIRQKYACERLV